jgi:two-component system, sensor histidine kinase
MVRRASHRGFQLILATTTALMAVGLVIMLVLSQRQGDSLQATAKLQADSMTALAFQLEREFLRLRGDLARASVAPTEPDWEGLALRYDIFLSRLVLINDNPSSQPLRTQTEFQALEPRLEALVAQAGPLLGSRTFLREDLSRLVRSMDAMGPDVQSLTLAANRMVMQQQEEQLQTLQAQQRLIMGLILAQVGVLLLASLGLLVRQQRQQKQQQALETLNEELRTAKEQADSASQDKSRFLANMSHELRTPFNGMLGMLDLLEDSVLTAQQRDHLHTARGSAQHLLSLLNDILDMSALEAGKIRLMREPVNLVRLVSDVHRLMLNSANRKNLPLLLVLPDEEPEQVLTDPTRIRQILFNLLSNAIKFTERGHVRLEMAYVAQDDGLLWTFTVHDTGIGMDDETLARLFQRFQQADRSATRRYGGSGLGLEISRTLARMMDGDIQVRSAQGRGSTFTFTLHTPLVSRMPAAVDTRPAPLVNAPERNAALGQGCHILVAEDHPINRKFLGAWLEKLGHQVQFAENGQQALDWVQRQAFDLVFMDIHMPEMDGLTSARLIRALPGPCARIPIVALSADILKETEDEAMAAGMDQFLTKPVHKAQLEAALARWTRAATVPAQLE